MKNFRSTRIRFSLTEFAIAILFLFSTACESFNSSKEKPSTNLEIGEEIEVASQTISSSGGTVIVDDPTSVIDGLEIVVPSNSYPGSKTFKISTAEITNSTLGEFFNPITPLIQIENGGGYADSIMEITIPIDLPEGHFAMGFYYDEATGRLEGIPVIKETSSSVTLATRHFMAGNEIRKGDPSLKGSPLSFNASANLVISSISESMLNGQKIITTGFKPKTDDYEFTNYGSYIVPNGHCAGQSITMMWYYYEKKLNGASPLFSLFDETDDLWQDNPYCFRWASVVQKDLDWDGNYFKLLKHIRITPDYHFLSWKAFAYSMLVTGSPQYCGLTSLEGGHAIIAHKINLTTNTLPTPIFRGRNVKSNSTATNFCPIVRSKTRMK